MVQPHPLAPSPNGGNMLSLGVLFGEGDFCFKEGLTPLLDTPLGVKGWLEVFFLSKFKGF
jgi:hypothetical protein